LSALSLPLGPALRSLSLTRPTGSGASSFKIATQLVHPDKVIDDPYMCSNTPIYQTATFGQPSATTFGPYDYTRSGNPTRTVLEKQMAALEGAHGAFAACRVGSRVSSTRFHSQYIASCGLFEGKGVSTSRVSPPGPLSMSYGHVGCLKARAFPPPV
jgi:hypothetical protein